MQAASRMRQEAAPRMGQDFVGAGSLRRPHPAFGHPLPEGEGFDPSLPGHGALPTTNVPRIFINVLQCQDTSRDKARPVSTASPAPQQYQANHVSLRESSTFKSTPMLA